MRRSLLASLLLLVGAALLLAFAAGVWLVVANEEDHYVGVVDAGSTGSRVHIFHFQRSILGGPLSLVEEWEKRVRPGLSILADDPSQAARSVTELLDFARAHVPEQKRSTTPFVLRATGGLRQLPDGKGKAILDKVGLNSIQIDRGLRFPGVIGV